MEHSKLQLELFEGREGNYFGFEFTLGWVMSSFGKNSCPYHVNSMHIGSIVIKGEICIMLMGCD